MAKSRAKDALKLYAEQPPEADRPQVAAIGSLPDLLRAFQAATGWSLRYVAGPPPSESKGMVWSAPVSPGVGVPPGHLRLDSIRPDVGRRRQPGLDADSARSLASAVSDMLGELIQTRHALWQREAELAAGVPLVPHPEEQRHLAARLEAVLKGGAEAVGCQAAALYLLDEATTELKLRSCWGLPLERLAQPARPLRSAMADLEALLGHAVVLEDTDLMRHWNVPEDFPSAVCVPVSTPTTLLGTLWVFGARKRDFNSRETNILEVVAGRLAADLEREMLLCEALETAELKRQLAAAQRLQRNQLPTVSPLLDGWELSGWSFQKALVGGDFYDWFCPGDGLLAVAVGNAMGCGLEAAMSASALKAALRAHGQYHRQAQETLKRVNLTLWTGSAGDQYATLFYGLIETATGRVCCASAGQPGVVVLRPDGWESLSQPCSQLGEGPEADFEDFGCELRPGEALAVFTNGVRDAVDSRGRPWGESGLADSLVARLDLSAEQLANLAEENLSGYASAQPRSDSTVLVVKRTHR